MKPVTLTPAQNHALESIEHGLTVTDVVSLWGGTGMGKTTGLRELQARIGGAWVGAREDRYIPRSG